MDWPESRLAEPCLNAAVFFAIGRQHRSFGYLLGERGADAVFVTMKGNQTLRQFVIAKAAVREERVQDLVPCVG